MKFLNTIENSRIVFVCYSQGFYTRIISCFIEFFIKNTILLSCEIDTPKTILTSNTRATKLTVTTVRTVLRIKYPIALVTIDTFIAIFIFCSKIHIEIIFRFHYSFHKHAIFIFSTIETQITISRSHLPSSKVGIFTIFIIGSMIECHHGHIVPELTNLF